MLFFVIFQNECIPVSVLKINPIPCIPFFFKFPDFFPGRRSEFRLFPAGISFSVIICCLAFLLFPSFLAAQQIRVEGSVKDTGGELLPFATILFLPDSTVVPADMEGKFGLSLEPGEKQVLVTFTGYKVLDLTVNLRNDTTLTFTLLPGMGQLDEVTVLGERIQGNDQVLSVRTGTTNISKKDVTGIPVFGGEADVIKTLQLLPGVVRGVEGSSDIFVRGGAADQNLVLLDGATIYNTSHLFGFLSVFNSDILENVEAINGGFPAEFGGRLSSVLNITSNNSIADRTRFSGEVGLIASRIYLEQPILKDKAGLWLSGRRTYIDQVLKGIGEELPYFFYDFNGKLLLKPSGRDFISLSHYSGEDILDLYTDSNDDGRGFISSYASGNSSQSFLWHRNLPFGWESKLSLVRTAFTYDIRNVFQDNELRAFSDIEDYGAHLTFEKDSLLEKFRVKAGIDWIRHEVSPNIINSSGFFSDFLESSTSPGKTAHEMAVHYQQEWDLSKRILVNAGFRGSMALLRNKKYFIPEPRLSFRYKLDDDQALKLSYSRMGQYMHRISNSAISTPADIWYPVTESIKPQRSHQVSAAWNRLMANRNVFLSVETYYKTMDNLIGYREGTNLIFNADFEPRLIQGRGEAYGLEILLRKETGRLRGWLSYTLARSTRQFDEINMGNPFPARYDRRHNAAIVGQYALHKRWAASVVWEYISGSRFTPVIGQYIMPAPTLTGVDLVPVFSAVNAVKLADSHRLDLGIKFMNKPGSKWEWHWFAGVNNAYNRASPVGIIIEQDETDNSLRYAQPGLFGLLPFISYGFSF